MTATPLVITRTFDAPVEKVWAAWTEPEQIKKWWGPANFSGPVAKVDLREGGKYLFCMRGVVEPGGNEQDFWSGGTYEAVVPMQKLVCLDSFMDKDGNMVSPSDYGMPDFPDVMRITIEFAPTSDGKTNMTITHEGAPEGENKANMNVGWNESLDKLAASLK